MLTGKLAASGLQPHGPAALSLKQFGAVMELRAARAYFYRTVSTYIHSVLVPEDLNFGTLSPVPDLH